MPSLDLLLYVDKQFASPYAMSVYVALQEKSLSFALQTVDLDAGEQRHRDYVAASLTQRVPTLVHNGFALSESSAIAEYVDEVFPGEALYPTEPSARARARQVQAWLRSDFLPLRAERTTRVLFYEPTKAALSEEAKASAAKLFAAVDQLLPDEGSHVAGHWSLADVDLALMLNRLVFNGDPVPAKLAAYAARQWQRASVQRWVGTVRPPL